VGPGNAYEEDRPHGLWKLEVNQTFSANFFLSAKAAYYNNGFGLFARGDNSYTYDYDQGEMLGNFYNYSPSAAEGTERRRQLLLEAWEGTTS